MSLIRTMLRVQAIEAMLADPVLDQMIQGRIYDARIAAFDHRDPTPTILVSAEGTKALALDHQNGGAPFELTTSLVLEIAMNAVAQFPVEGSEDPVEAIGYAATDSRLETRLDLIEERVIAALTQGETAAARLLNTLVVKRWPSFESEPFRTDQTGEKYAVHLLTFKVVLFTPDEPDPFDVPTGPYAVLPAYARTIAEASDPDGLPRAMCNDLIADLAPLPTPAEPQSFAGADMVLAPQTLDPGTTPSQADDTAAGRTVALAATIPAP